MLDFTIKTYSELLKALKSNNYSFQSFQEFLEAPLERSVILRHDIDLRPINALRIAKIEYEFGIHSTFYFQTSSNVYDIEIINEISGYGHEIGYHYKDIETVYKDRNYDKKLLEDNNSLIDLAYTSFVNNLNFLRKDFSIKTICMHGSPRCKLDNRIIWEKYSYKDLGIIGEPYFDMDWSNAIYLTDSSRSWNGDKFIVRDRVTSNLNHNFHSTFDIIENIDQLPNQVMINTHPQRWSDNKIFWTKEIVLQNIKNFLKGIFFVNK